MQLLTADLRAGIVSARRELAAARDTGDVGGIQLNEQRLRCLSVAAAEYGMRLADPVLQAGLGGQGAARG
ncbi:hypothetical protein [Catenulispora rubra]|uniref:hypothetical protein n=1 Tax=Catenulispora rubra TaxID=280293 RepID=UPI001892144E|nr:hypothetical protein [Catenulispora rubra]